MATQAAAPARPVARIEVELHIGSGLMAGSDDPLFLRLGGSSGREFRLQLDKGKGLRRGGEDLYVLGSPDDPATNVANAALNDPSSPALDLDGIDRVRLVKRGDFPPNVRGVAEMDDRVQLEEAEVRIFEKGNDVPHRYHRTGPHWLGLVCGLILELGRIDAPT